MDTAEIERLLRIIRGNGHQARYLPKTKEELVALGGFEAAEAVLGHTDIKPVEEPFNKDAVLGCITYTHGEMLCMPDNVVGLCDWGCGRMVQYRPWVPKELPRVCLYCMADRKKDDN
jgi:hypothetical protein